jgi:hypothetical protein
MKNLLLGTMLLALVLVLPIPTMAGADVGINISLPPLIVFAAPPEMIVIPETNVYVVADLDADFFFYNGWWWRPWEGRWYRSRNYSSGWGYYQYVPSFFRAIPSSWRNDYREHRWKGHQWNYQRIPHQQVQRNWSNWEKSKHWEKQNTWGVQGLKPRTQSQPQSREAAKPQRSQPQPREAVQPKQTREVQPQRSQPQSREAAKPRQAREVQPQRSQPQPRETVQPKQTREVQPQRSEPRQGKSERGGEEKKDKR